MKKTAIFLCLTILLSACFCMPMAASADGILSVSSVSVGNADSITEISYGLGSIQITMSDDVNPDTLSGVEFTKADGTAIKGFLLKSAEGAVINLSFGNLEIGTDYALKITSDLLSDDGVAATPVSYSYKAIASVITYDFDDMSVMDSPISKSSFESLTDFKGEHYATTQATSGVYQVLDDGSGNNYLRMTGSDLTRRDWGATVRSALSYLFDEPIKGGTVTLTYRVKNEVGKHPGALHRTGAVLVCGSNSTTPSGSIGNHVCAGNDEMYLQDSGSCGWTVLGTAPGDLVADSDGWNKVKVVASYDPGARKWKGEFYVVTPDGAEMLASEGVSAAGARLIGFDLGHAAWDVYTEIAPADKTPYMAYDDIKIEISSSARVGTGDAQAALPNKESFSLYLTDDIESTTISATLKKQGASSEIAATCVYDEQARKVTVSPKAYLKYNTTYEVNIDGVATYSFTTAQAPVTVSNKTLRYKVGENPETVAAPSGACKAIAKANINADASTLGAGREILMMLVAYDSEGVILGAAQQIETITGETSLPVNPMVSLDLADGSAVARMGLFVFEKTANGGWISVPSA
ncbi:MAG: hypothetical protein IKB60_06035 [Clostridia bacterium]|nr:hypothetical protein [Clostridia bacterium]